MEQHRKRKLIERCDLEERCLDTLSDDFFLLVTGQRGSGKSTLCIEIIKQLQRREGCLDVYKIQEPDEWSGINFDTENEIVVLIDDFCDEAIYPSNKFENWKPYIEDIANCAQQEKAFIVIAVESNILSEIQLLLPNYCLLAHCTRFDLTKKWTLSFDEKWKYFWLLYQNCKISVKNNLDESDITKICECKTKISFFKVCQCFFEKQENYEKGLKYFKQAEIDYNSLINRIYSKQFAHFSVVFCTLILGKFDFSERTLDVLAKICSGFGEKCPSVDELKMALCNLNESGVLENIHGDTIHKVSDLSNVLPVVANHNIRLFLDIGGKDVLSYLRPQNYKPRPEEACVSIPIRYYPLLTDILLSEFSLNAIKNYFRNENCFSHPACSDKYILKELFSRMKEKWPEKIRSEYSIAIAHWACFSGNANLLEQVLSLFDVGMMTPEVFNRAVKEALLSSNICENVINILVHSKYLRFMKVENILPLMKTSFLKLKVLRKILNEVTFNDQEVHDLIIKVLMCRDISAPMKRTVVNLSSRLQMSNMLELIKMIIDKHLHHEGYILRSLMKGTHIMISAEQNKVFIFTLEKLLQSHTDLNAHLGVVREWEVGSCFCEVDREDLARLIFIKPLEKPWIEEYVEDNIIKKLSRYLHKNQLYEIIKQCVYKGIGIESTEDIVKSSGKVFYRFDIWQILIELFDSYESIRNHGNRVLELSFIRKGFEECHIRVLENIMTSTESPQLVHTLFHFVLTLALCTKLKSKGVFHLCHIIKPYNLSELFRFFRLLASSHSETGMTLRYSTNLARCILNKDLDIKDTFFAYVMIQTRNRDTLPTFLYRCIFYVCALERKIDISMVNEISPDEKPPDGMPPDGIESLIWKILSMCCRRVEEKKDFILFIFDLLLVHQHQMSKNTLLLVVSIALDKKFSVHLEECFDWIKRFLGLVPYIDHDLLQSILMKLIRCQRLSGSTFENVKIVIDRTLTSSEPRVSSSSVLKILYFACTSTFQDESLLSMLIWNSNIFSSDPSKLLHVLRTAVRHRSYSVLNALFDCGVLSELCAIVKSPSHRSSPRDMDALCNNFLILSIDHLYLGYKKKGKGSRIETLWRNFFEIPERKEHYLRFNLLSETVNAYSACGEIEVNLIIDFMLKYCIHKQDIAYQEVDDFYETLIQKSRGNIKIAGEKMIKILDHGSFPFFKNINKILLTDWVSLDFDILCGIFESLNYFSHESNFYYAHESHFKHLINTFSNATYDDTFDGTFGFEYATHRLWSCDEVSDALSAFLKSTVFPALNVHRISFALRKCIDYPDHAVTIALMECLNLNHCKDSVTMIGMLKDYYPGNFVMLAFVNCLSSPGINILNVALVNHIYQKEAKESNSVVYIDMDDAAHNQDQKWSNSGVGRLNDLDLLMSLVPLWLKGNLIENTTLKFAVPIRHKDVSPSGSVEYVVRNYSDNVCTVKLVCHNCEITVEFTFYPDGVMTSLCMDKFNTHNQYLMSLISAVACSELRPHVNDLCTVIYIIYDKWGELKEKRISLPIGGYVINIKVIDIFSIYLCHHYIRANKQVKDSLMRRIQFLELTQNDDYNNVGETCCKTLLYSFISIDHLLQSFYKVAKRESFPWKIFAHCENDLNMVRLFISFIMRYVCDEQDSFFIFIYLIQQLGGNFDEDQSIYSMRMPKLTCINHTIVTKHLSCVDFSVEISIFAIWKRFLDSPTLKSSPEYRMNCLEGLAETWNFTKCTEIQRSYFIKLMNTHEWTSLVRSEISSKVQLLSAKYILKYLEISISILEWDVFELFIQHMNITSGVLRKTFICLLEKAKCESDWYMDNFFSSFVSHAMSLNIKDLLHIVRALKKDELTAKIIRIETSIVTECLANKDSSQVNSFALDYFTLYGLHDPRTNVIFVDIRKPTIMVILSRFLAPVKVSKGGIIIQDGITSECHGYKYEFGIPNLKEVVIEMSSDKDKPKKSQYIISSHLMNVRSENEVMELMSVFLSLDNHCLELVYFLIDSLPFTLSSESWTYTLVKVIQHYLARVNNVEILSELDQAEPDVIGLERFLKTKHGQTLISQEQSEKIIQTTIKSYVNSTEMISLILCYYNKVSMNYKTVIRLSETAITVPYVRSAEYLDIFLKEAGITEIFQIDVKRLFDACLRSPCDQNRSLDIILSLCPDIEAKQNVTNNSLMGSVQNNTFGNHSTLLCFRKNYTLLLEDYVFMCLVSNAFFMTSKKASSEQSIMISIDKGTRNEDMIFVKLLHLYLLHHNYRYVHQMFIKKSLVTETEDLTFEISLMYEGQIVFKVQIMLSPLPSYTDTDMTEVSINIMPTKSMSSPNIVNMSLNAIETEENVNPLIQMLYETTETVQFSDEELQMLFCAMINRKHMGREDYIHSLLSSPMYSGISDKSVTGILRTATTKQRNNITIIDRFLKEAERCGIIISEPNMKLLISDLCECRHRRTDLYLRKLLQSPITQDGLSDDVFITALTSYVRDNVENSEILLTLKKSKSDVSENFRSLLDKLKSDIQELSQLDDGDDDDDDDESIILKRKEEIERKTKLIDGIIMFYFSMETDP